MSGYDDFCVLSTLQASYNSALSPLGKNMRSEFAFGVRRSEQNSSAGERTILFKLTFPR
jgi:hypothetical protein